MNFYRVIQPLRKLVGVAYTSESRLTGVGYTGVGYTGKSGLTGLGYTGESRHIGVSLLGESTKKFFSQTHATLGSLDSPL